MSWKQYADVNLGSERPTAASFEAGTVPINYSGWPLQRPAAQYPPLEQDITADVVVIGAGITGSSLALHLAERGVSTVLLEADQPASGASGRNAGHIQPYLSSFVPLQAHSDGGKRFTDYFINHRNIVFDLTRKYGIEADVASRGLIEAAKKPQQALERKARLWQSHGYKIETLGPDQLRQMLGTDSYQYGLHWHEGGQVNPYLFTNGMVSAAEGLGVKVYGNSRVIACNSVDGGWKVRTEKGSVRATQVVICTNGHTDSPFFPELSKTNYPLVACGLATKPLPESLLRTINPARVVLSQYPSGLFPLLIDERNRLVTATIPGLGKAAEAQVYFNLFLRYLHRNFPQTRDVKIELESYWTGMTANSSHKYDQCYPKLYQVEQGVHALINFGSWGNLLGPMMAQSLAHAIADNRVDNCVLPIETPKAVRFPSLFETKIRRALIPLARLADRFDRA